MHKSSFITPSYLVTENDGTVRLLNTQDIPFPMAMEITKEELLRTGWTTYQEKLKYTMCFKKPEGHCQVRNADYN